MTDIDIDEIVEQREPVLLVNDQAPFESGGNTFCTLIPLMTLSGERFEDIHHFFPSRGVVWWMLSSEQRSQQIQPGAIWTAELEIGPRWTRSDDQTRVEKYQARRAGMHAGAGSWLEVIDVDSDEPDLARILATDGLPFDRQPLHRVMVRGRRSVVGPFHTAWDAGRQMVTLESVNLNKHLAYVSDLDVLGLEAEVETFDIEVCQQKDRDPPRQARIHLVRDSILSALEAHGKEIDASSDAQIIKWGLEQAGLTNRKIRAFRRELESVREAIGTVGDVEADRKRRFAHIVTSAEQVLAAGDEIAELVADQPAFEELLRSRMDELVSTRVNELVRGKKREIDRQVEEAEARRDRLKSEISKVESEYDTRKQEQERRLETENAEWVKSLERLARELEEREQAVGERESEIETRLAQVISDYVDRGEEVARRILGDFPVLRRLGLGGELSGELSPTTGLLLPEHLDHPVARSGITEAAFMDQYREHVARRGFKFSEADLVNFHVAVKTGAWSVLAGPTGTGKSSLPRLYAEALGIGERYLTIPVRPDWLDDRDVLGAFNSLSGRFEPAATGLVEHLIAAHEDHARQAGGLYLVCLDEMNLARVEHYFAQLLSVLEEQGSRRRLRLFSRGAERPQEPFARWRHLPLGDNVRFIGTVNVDETTHFFSPKVLDRAAVLTFDQPDLEHVPGEVRQAQDLMLTTVHVDEYRSWIRGQEDAPASARTLLLAVSAKLEPIRSGLGYRARNRVLAHVASSKGLLEADSALDYSLAQTVLPRLRVHMPGFNDVADAVLSLLPENRFPRSHDRLSRMRRAEGRDDFFQLL